MNKLLIIILLPILACSCGEKFALSKDKLTVLPENKEWLIAAETGSSFIMTDNHNISQGFSMYQNSTGFSPSTSSYFGVRTNITETESYSQGYSSVYGQRFSYTLTAGNEPFGDNLTVSLNDLLFTYDFKFGTISRLNLESNYKSKTMTDQGYEITDTIFSTIEILDSLTVNGFTFSGVMHFSFSDFADKWTPLTIRDVYLAKQYGLVRYSLENGITYERIKD